ncbi:hypothetical protein AB0L70_15960 [Kribbella sp. NPDC051952]|uniref:hypothetical protein n=1 Tax=Kribbella sp. NPDC051952 TaxID=3154851 RepID=UPI0034338EC7
MSPEDFSDRSARSMADLARGAGVMADQPGSQVNFHVHHVPDRPGYIKSQLEDESTLLRHSSEVLISNLNGIVLAVGSNRGALAQDMRARQQGSSTPVRAKIDVGPDRLQVVGAAMPNPSFIYEAAARFEALIALEVEECALRQFHARALIRLVGEVAQCAAHEGSAPIMSLQCPVQLPPERANGARVEDQKDIWNAPNVIAVRVVFALQNPTSQRRMKMASRLADYCSERGYGLWLGDLRPGHAQGNWFRVHNYDPLAVKRFIGRQPELRRSDTAVKKVMPVTLVGPARVGSTNAIMSVLRRCPRLGVAGCAITALDDVAFVHLQLTSDEFSDPTAALGDPNRYDGGIFDRLQRVVSAMGDDLRGADTPDGDPEDPLSTPHSRLVERAGDYQMFAGPVLDVETLSGLHRRPLWFSWRQSSPDGGWLLPFAALQAALEDCGLWRESASGPLDCANFEYMVCRGLDGSIYTVKGKLTVPESLIPEGNVVEYDATRLCVGVETAWRARLDERPVTGLHWLSFAWRENFLGNGRTR